MSKTVNKGSVIKIIRDDLSLKNKIIAVDIYFTKGKLPKIGNALTILHTRTPGRTNEIPVSFDFDFEGVDLTTNEPLVMKVFETISEVPVVLEASKILNENIVRAFVIIPCESLIELIKDLPLGIEVIDTGELLVDTGEES